MTAPASPVRSPVRRHAREVARFAVLVGVLLSARSSLADHYYVPSGSMQPSVEINDHVLVNKAAYGVRVPFSRAFVARFAGPAVGDVVVLDAPDEDKVLLKRDGALRELLGGADHPVRLTAGGGPDFGPVTIPDGRYLVIGDNRGDSRDGRYFGLVTREAILGRAVGVIWRGGPTWDGL
jgi:signal peptidase I